jgi:hypothetical protein
MAVQDVQKKAWMFQLLSACEYMHSNSMIIRTLNPGGVSVFVLNSKYLLIISDYIALKSANIESSSSIWIPKITEISFACMLWHPEPKANNNAGMALNFERTLLSLRQHYLKENMTRHSLPVGLKSM